MQGETGRHSGLVERLTSCVTGDFGLNIFVSVIIYEDGVVAYLLSLVHNNDSPSHAVRGCIAVRDLLSESYSGGC